MVGVLKQLGQFYSTNSYHQCGHELGGLAPRAVEGILVAGFRIPFSGVALHRFADGSFHSLDGSLASSSLGVAFRAILRPHRLSRLPIAFLGSGGSFR
jgi:hypothetical protein